MARRREEAAAGARRPEAAGPDFSFARFTGDVVLLDSGADDVDLRLLAALSLVRAALGQAPEVTRYLGLGSALDNASSAIDSADATAMLAHVSASSTVLAELIESMRLADEAIAEGIGINAVASLLAAPQRMFAVGDAVVLLGMFASVDAPEHQLALMLRWRVTRHAGYVDVSLEEIEEPGGEEGGVARLLTELAYETAARPLSPRARAAVLLGPGVLDALGDIDAIARRTSAVGVVRDVATEVLAVSDVRNLSQLDRQLADRAYDILLLSVEGEAGWAWRRAEAFQREGGQFAQVYAVDLDSLAAQVGECLRDIVGGPDLVTPDEGEEIHSSLSEEERAVVSAALEAGPIKVVFVGGNETQERYHAKIEADLARGIGAGISIVWFGGWGSNWNVIADGVRGELADADVVVLMQFVRTQLGRAVRKAAGDHDLEWVPCTSSGRQSLQHSIETALRIVAQRRAT